MMNKKIRCNLTYSYKLTMYMEAGFFSYYAQSCSKYDEFIGIPYQIQGYVNSLSILSAYLFQHYNIIMQDSSYRIVLVQSCRQVQEGYDVRTDRADFTLKDFVVKKGTSFWSVDDDFQAIYNSFNILSYFSPSCKIRILNKKENRQKLNNGLSYEFCFSNQDKIHTLLQKERQPFSKEFLKNNQNKKLKISYGIIEDDQRDKEAKWNVEVLFSIRKQKLEKQKKIQFLRFNNKQSNLNLEREQIVIDILDSDGWIKQNFSNIAQQAHHKRVSQFLKPRLGQIEYFYQEPQNLRCKIIREEHISLALQGGGCKGVQYIGAYKAILQKKYPITSVIGSSAGGIIGLAVCCGLDPQEIVKICTERLSKVTNDQRYGQINDVEEQKIKKLYHKLIKLVEDLNIFDENIIGIMKSFMEDPTFKKLLLQYIKASVDPEVAKLFTFTDSPNTLNLEGLLNAALMTGQKMREIASEILKMFLFRFIKLKNENCQQYFHIKNFKDFYDLSQQKNTSGKYSKQIADKMTQVSQSLTMAELYELNGVQFTCTAVDLDDHILRFFNKKTTPNLPVCYAVQMTGSFPVAFEAQRWKQKWGKYLIHYDNIRRQIDLTNHRFTDGGTLSNFPIKYLDNQEMRPMYFSHAKTKNTKMYGIGFREQVTKSPEKQELKKLKMQQITDLLSSKVSKVKTFFKWLINLVKSDPKPILTSVSPAKIIEIKKQIPLIEFVQSILETYSKTKDNLIEQCFAHVIFELKASKNYRRQIRDRVRPKNLKDQINNLIFLIEKLANQSNKVEEIYSSFKANLDYFAQNHLDFSCLEEKLCQALRIVISNTESFFFYLFEDTTKQQEQLMQKMLANCIRKRNISLNNDDKQAISQLFDLLQSIRKEKVFVLCNIDQDLQVLNQVNLMIQQLCNNIKQSPIISTFVDRALKKARRYEEKWVKQIIQYLKEYSRSLDGIGKKISKNHIANIIKSTSKLPNLTLTLPIQKINQTLMAYMIQGVPEFFINAEVLYKKNLLNSYVLKRISNQVRESEKGIMQQGHRQLMLQEKINTRGLHIVLEPAALSEIYFHKYMTFLKNTLFRYNQEYRDSLPIKQLWQNQLQFNMDFQKVKVSSITVTGYQSIIVFLHATDLLDHQIEEEVWNLRDFISIDENKVKQKQQKLNWVKMTPILLRQFERLAHEKQKDIFTYIETQIIQKSDYSDIKKFVESSMTNVELSREDLIEAIDTSLNFVMSILVTLENSNDTSKNKIDELIKQMALNTPQNYAGYYMGLYSQGLKSMCQFFFKKYHDIVKYISYSSPIIIDDVLRMLPPQDRKLAWKGAILPGVLSGKQIKQYVQKILVRLKLKPDTTLKQFYDLSNKKIQINLSVVEQSLVSILNRVTRPNMPVWAAILAAVSIPQFYAPVLDKEQWKYRAFQQFELRKMKAYFQGEKKSYRFLSSSLALTTMPLDLLQNGKFRKKINFGSNKQLGKQNKKWKIQTGCHFEDSENQIYLVFCFQNFILSDLNTLMFTQNKQKNNQQYRFTITPLTLPELVNQFVSFRSIMNEKVGSNKLATAKQNINIEGIKNFKNLAPFVSKAKIMGLYVESHDNLIKNLYKKQLVLMPVRFSTLDFNSMISLESKGTSDEKLSDICEDAIMQAYYAVKQKWENSYDESVFQMAIYGELTYASAQKTSIPKKRILGDELFNQANRRLLYFRIESEMFGQIKEQNTNKTILSNRIRIRFLSLLNTSREIYQQYFAFIRGYKQDERGRQQAYIQLKQQALSLSSDLHEKITLKIEYPDPSKLQIRVAYFELNLFDLFKLNSQLRVKNKERFGFVYCLKFDNFYSQYNNSTSLQPLNSEGDYMNKKLNGFDYKAIPIKSDVKQTIYEKIMCKDCVYPFTVHPKSERKDKQNPQLVDFGSQSYVTCDKCNKVSNPLRKHYLIQLDQRQQKLKCLLGHTIFMNQVNEQLQYQLCDLCGKGCFKSYWRDTKCNLSFCHNCRDINVAYL